MRDITRPGATINPDHLGYIVELDDGSTMAGIVAADTAAVLSLADASGKVTALEKSRVRTKKPMATSLMPKGLLQTARHGSDA